MRTSTMGLCCALASSTVGLRAQCASTWLPGFGFPGTNSPAAASVTWDPDGAGPLGPRLVVGGTFSIAGSVGAARVATWDPATGVWAALGAGLPANVTELAVLANGELVAATFATTPAPNARVWRWTGISWLQLGNVFDAPVLCLQGLASGDLIAGGAFTNVSPGTARWNGTSWAPFAAVTGTVRSMAIVANGDLVIGGTFNQVGGVAANCIARWNGTTWSPLGTGMFPIGVDGVYAIAPLSNGSIVAGGFFPNAGGGQCNNIALWNGSAWSNLGYGVAPNWPQGGSVLSLAVLPNGQVVAGGMFSTAGGLVVHSVARWDGSSWQAMAQGLERPQYWLSAKVFDLTVLPNGDVVACGDFESTGSSLGDGVSRWDGTAWRALSGGFNDGVLAAATLPGGDVVVGGTFTIAGHAGGRHIARRSGGSWVPMGNGLGDRAVAMAVRPNGELIVAGGFSWAGNGSAACVARWNGSWFPMGSGLNNAASSLAVMPNGDVVVGGVFSSAGGVAAACVARWNGSTWSAMGAGVNGAVAALHARPDGTLVVGGQFSSAGAQPVSNVATWDGTAWAPMGSLTAPAAFATTTSGDLVAASGNEVLRWTGTSWTTFGAADGTILTVCALPDDDLIVGGGFQTIAGVPASFAARWTGAVWQSIGAGPNATVRYATMLPEGQVLLGGDFSFAGGALSPHVARLGTTCPATAVPAGAGCPSSGGANLLTVRELPWLGGALRTRSVGLPGNTIVAVVTGFSPASLPLASVLPIGQAGCVLHVTPDLVDLVAGSQSIEAALPIPPTLALIGQTFWHQHAPIQTSGAGALTATNAFALTIGSF